MKRPPWIVVLAAIVAAAVAASLAGYDVGYADGWNEALHYADIEDMKLRGVEP